MPLRPFRISLGAGLAAVSAVVLTSVGAAADSSDHNFDSSNLKASSHRFGETKPHSGAQTIPLWTGHTTNPDTGVTYTYTMVGANPAENEATTVQVDIVPVNVTLAGSAFNGSDAVNAVLASPLFRTADFSGTTAASTTAGGPGSGGELSEDNEDVQLLDAIMRAQFNKVGTRYHVKLAKPTVHRPLTLNVPISAGLAPTSRGGVTYAVVDETWFQPQIEGLSSRLNYLKPQRLALFVTKNVVLFADHTPTHCCVFGAHGSVDSTKRNEDKRHQSVQTFAWSSWLTAGFFDPTKTWATQDISALSHEITEWANDPFGTNPTQPWFSPIAPQYGCSALLETGDPTLNVGFSIGKNRFDQNLFTDGTYHAQDEAFLPWFMHTAPNHVSQATQSGSGGRYTFLGDLNPFPFFHGPAPTC